MGIEKLFGKCPVLPADPTISIARYLRSIRQTIRQASESEETGEIERAALLQIRVLQLICKTLPAHPEHALAENQPVIKEMQSIAHDGFANVERLAGLLSDEGKLDQEPAAERVARGRSRAKHIKISMGLLDLFEKIAVEHTAKGVRTVAILGGRVEAQESAAEESSNTVLVTALVIPSQVPLLDRSNVRYETDVTDLMARKGLIQVGFVEMCPNLNNVALTPASAMVLARLQKREPSAFGVVIAPQDASRVGAFSVNEDYGLDYLLECEERDIPAHEKVPRGHPGKGKAIWSTADEVEFEHGSEPMFKLYDLRPLAAARDEHERSTTKVSPD